MKLHPALLIACLCASSQATWGAQECVPLQVGHTQNYRSEGVIQGVVILPDRVAAEVFYTGQASVRIGLNEVMRKKKDSIQIDWDNDLVRFYQTRPLCITPAQEFPQTEITPFLKRLTHWKTFKPEQDLPPLLFLLSQFSQEKIPLKGDLLFPVLRSILTYSDALFDSLIETYPKVLDLTEPNHMGDNEDVAFATLAYARDLMQRRKTRIYWENWKVLGILSPMLQFMGDAERIKHSEDIGEVLARTALETDTYKMAFISMLLKISGRVIREQYFENTASRAQLQKKPLTDLSLLRTPQTITPLVVGSLPINGDPSSFNRYGFYAKVLPTIQVPTNSDTGTILSKTDIQWKQGESSFKAPLDITIGEWQNSIPTGDGPNYSELFLDGVLTGAVITGTSVGEYAPKILDDLLNFYERRDYNFEPEGRDYQLEEIDNLKEWLEEKIVSGELDYFTKEAHSEGDQKNIFFLNRKAWALVGTKIRSDKKLERIYLIYPHEENTVEGDALPNEEFGAWIRAREANKKGQLVYFNLSCNSKSKAVPEIEATRSTLLLNIPTTTNIRFFSQDPWDPEVLLFDAFLNGANFPEMRKALSRNEEYRTKKMGVIIFPDEPDYDELIRQVLKVQLHIRPIEIWEGTKRYNLNSILP